MGIKSISSAFDISRNTVRRYVRMYQDSGIPAEKLPSLSDARLQELFSIPGAREHKPSERQIRLEALLPEYAARLSRKGMTVKKLYEEYHAGHPDGYLHASFGMKLRQFMLQTNAIGHVEHRAGDRMYVDFAGDRLEIVDEATAEVRKVEVFVAILPCSHYTYCEAVWSQKKEDLIKACENAIRFYGGAPCAIVPDNLKSAVTRSDRNEPVINPDFEAFAEHYGCAVVPARVRHPRDKALVENAVKLMYRSVYVDLEGMLFHDLESLNVAILKSLEKFNARNLTRRRESRRQLFDSIERDSLRPLPPDRYQMRQRTVATVQRNSYVTLNKHHYSVPVQYVGKRVEMVYDTDTIDIFHGFTHVATHHRNDTPYEYTTKPSHNLPGRKGSCESDLQELLSRAAVIDNIVVHYLRAVIEDKRYPELAFRTCRGIMNLEKKYGQERLVSGCAAAMDARRYSISDMVDILDSGADADYLPGAEADDREPRRPAHRNIRGKEYFAASIRQSTQNDNVKMETNDKTSPVTPEKDRNSVSLDLMHRMRLHGMAAAFSESLQATFAETMTPDSFLNWLLSREWDYRVARNIERLVKGANFRYNDASVAQIDYTLPRGLDRNQMERLASLDFVRKGDNLFITGCAGTGKSYLATALGYEACKAGMRVMYANASKLMGTLKIAKNKGTIEAELKKLEKTQLLILDDLFLVPLDAKERAHLTEIIEDRHGRKSIIVTSQLPELDWYDAIGDTTVADAILDRIVHTAHRITLTGESVRKLKAFKGR